MSTAAIREVVRQIGQDDPPSDASLLARYLASRDHAAFAELLRRYGPVVFGVCRRLLANRHDAEDAFQAVFLVLALKADSVRPAGFVGNWLYGVAVRTANKAKLAAARRWRREMAVAMKKPEASEPTCSAELAELRSAIDGELARLPDHLRAAVVLCDLGGKSRREAARELDCPEGTVAARLHRARKLLAERFAKRGIALSSSGLAAAITPEVATAYVSSELARKTLAATVGISAASPAVQTLASGVMRTMSIGKFKVILAAVAVAGLLTGAGALWGANNGESRVETREVATVTAPPEPAASTPAAVPGYVHSIAFSPDGKLHIVSPGASVRESSGKVLFNVPGETAGFSPDGKTIIAMGSKAVTTHDAESGKELKSFPRPKTDLGWHIVSFSPDGKRYAAHFGFNVRVYDTATGFEPVRLRDQHEPGGSGFPGTTGKQLTWSADGKHLKPHTMTTLLTLLLARSVEPKQQMCGSKFSLSNQSSSIMPSGRGPGKATGR